MSLPTLLLNVAKKKMEKGKKKYGKFDPKTDTRNFLWEFFDEIADAYNYLFMYACQLEAKNFLTDNAKILVVKLSDRLRELEPLVLQLQEEAQSVQRKDNEEGQLCFPF